MDDKLNDRARRLLDVVLAQDLPPADVVEDSWGMVISRVTAQQTEAASVVQREVVVQAAAPSWHRTAIAVVIVAVVATGGWLALRPATLEPAPAVPTVAPPVTTTKPAQIEAPTTPPAQLLDEAEASLATAPMRALELLDRHAAVAPAAEADRRMALRIEVLCALGRKDDATAEATAFLGAPRALRWEARVHDSCGVSAGAP